MGFEWSEISAKMEKGFSAKYENISKKGYKIVQAFLF